eukprot:COSAG06_NODE_1985_length_7908_cov_11.907671_1_plen_734_part_00
MLAESGLVSVEHQRKLEDAKEKLQQKEEQRRDTETQAATKKRECEKEMQRLKEEIEELKADLARKPEPGQVQPEPQQQALRRDLRDLDADVAIIGPQNADMSEADLRKELKRRGLYDYPNATDKNLLIAKLADDIRRDGILGPENAAISAKSVPHLKKELEKRGLSTSPPTTGTELDGLKARLAADITRKDGLAADITRKESELKQKKQEARVAKDDLAESKQVHEEAVAALKAEVAALKRPTAIKTILDKHGFGDGVLLEHLAHADEETLYNIRLEFKEQGAPSQMVTRFERAIEGARPCPGDVIHEQLCKQSIEQLEHKAMGYIASGHVEGAEVLGARHDKDALVKLLAQGEIAKHEKERAETRKAAEEKGRLKKEAEERARAEANRRAELEKQEAEVARARGDQFTVTVSDFGDADNIEDLGLEFKEAAGGKTEVKFPWLAFDAGGKVAEESTFVTKGTALVKIKVPTGEGTSVYEVKQQVLKSKAITDAAEKAYADKTRTALKDGDGQWQKDADAPNCPLCEVKLKSGVPSGNRSHCRKCGKLFCKKCCAEKRNFGEQGKEKEELVCDSCVEQLATEKEELEKLKLEAALGPLEQFLEAASGPLTLTFQPPAKNSTAGSADFLGSAAGALGGAAGALAAVANNPLAQMAANVVAPGVGGALLAGVGNAAGAAANLAGAAEGAAGAVQAAQDAAGAAANGDFSGAVGGMQDAAAQGRDAAAAAGVGGGAQ